MFPLGNGDGEAIFRVESNSDEFAASIYFSG
jgi:hypothetical protein